MAEIKVPFIIGKGLGIPISASKEDVINHNNKEFFIPTYGFSGSDVYMTSYKKHSRNHVWWEG